MPINLAWISQLVVLARVRRSCWTRHDAPLAVPTLVAYVVFVTALARPGRGSSPGCGRRVPAAAPRGQRRPWRSARWPRSSVPATSRRPRPQPDRAVVLAVVAIAERRR